MKLTPLALENLEASGLSEDTIEKMRVRMANANDFPNGNVHTGYVIPYLVPNRKTGKYGIVAEDGAPFNRIRLLNSKPGAPKYLQSKFSGTHIYFPPFVNAMDWFDEDIPLFITEGEKKAAAACQHGFMTCAVSGVDSWRSRLLNIRAERITNLDAQKVSIQLDDNDVSKIETRVSPELMELPLEGREIYIVFDSDISIPTMEAVQRAAFDLAIWLDHQGAEPKQIILPYGTRDKIGLDDFLMEFGKVGFSKVMNQAMYPFRPKIKGWINKQLSQKNKTRDVYIRVAKAILATLDRKGIRYRDKLGNFFYFDKTTNMLHVIRTEKQGLSRTSTFMRLLVNEYGIHGQDKDVLGRLLDDFQSTNPIEEIDRTFQGSVARDDAFYYQLSDSRMVKVTKNDMLILRNGEDGILFESGVKEAKLIEAPKTYQETSEEDAFGWMSILKETSLKPMAPLDMDETYALIAALFYASPWLLRWKGTMLPVELALGEAGSGKSTLYQLRRAIYTGSPRLNQPPSSMKDWYASIGDTHGMWVADNMGSKLSDDFSNEIARMITDPEPTFELRELFTTHDVSRQYVNCTFCFTSIYSPIQKPDLLQRSFLLEFEQIEGVNKDGKWLEHQIAEDGRDRWIAHHLDMIQKFLKEAENIDWNQKSSHRLVNLEQVLRVFGRVMGKEAEIEKAIHRMGDIFSKRVVNSNPVIEALATFAFEETEEFKREMKEFTALQIVEWVLEDPEQRFDNIRVLHSARSLGKFLVTHKADVYEASGIKLVAEKSRRKYYNVDKERMVKLREMG